MSDREVFEMQKKIDKGILLAQERMLERSRLFQSTVVVAREGQVIEVKPEELSAGYGQAGRQTADARHTI